MQKVLKAVNNFKVRGEDGCLTCRAQAWSVAMGEVVGTRHGWSAEGALDQARTRRVEDGLRRVGNCTSEQPSGRALSRRARLVGRGRCGTRRTGMGRSRREHVQRLVRDRDQGRV